MTSEDQSPIVAFVRGSPEPTRLLGRSMGGGEAMIGSELFQALEGESVGQFRRRLADVARERSAGCGRKVIAVSVGSDRPMMASRYNMDGTERVLN